MTAVGTPQNPTIHVSNLYKICKTLNVHPTDFLQNLQSGRLQVLKEICWMYVKKKFYAR